MLTFVNLRIAFVSSSSGHGHYPPGGGSPSPHHTPASACWPPPPSWPAPPSSRPHTCWSRHVIHVTRDLAPTCDTNTPWSWPRYTTERPYPSGPRLITEGSNVFTLSCHIWSLVHLRVDQQLCRCNNLPYLDVKSLHFKIAAFLLTAFPKPVLRVKNRKNYTNCFYSFLRPSPGLAPGLLPWLARARRNTPSKKELGLVRCVLVRKWSL